MKRFSLLTGLVTALCVGSPTMASDWFSVPTGLDDCPVHTVEFEPGQFWNGNYFAATEEGVIRGDGLLGNWEIVGSDYPGLPAYSVHRRQGAGWSKHMINRTALPHATGVGIADLGGSGYADIVVAAKDGSDKVVWYENRRSGELVQFFWDQHVIGEPAVGAREVSIGDLDNDGDPDIAVALRDEDCIVWYERSWSTDDPPELIWIRHDVGDALAGPRGVFIADVNADSRPDIVAGGMNVDTVVWIEAPPNPAQSDAWITHYVDTALDGVKGVHASDIDQDGDLDIVAAGRDAGHVVWYQQESLVPEVWTKRFIDTGLAGAVSVWAGDLTGDGRPDVAVTAKTADKVMLYEGPDDVTGPWNSVVVDPFLDAACAIAAGDLDGDGRTDLVATGKDAQVVAWYRAPWNGSHPWQKLVIDDDAGSAMGVTVGDLDGDGHLDVVSTNLEGQVNRYLNNIGELLCAQSEGSGACESDGIYRWHDDAGRWEASFWCGRPFFIDEDPHNPGVFACGSQEGLYLSANLVDWREVGAGSLPDTIRCIWYHPEQRGVLLVGTNSGIYRSTNGGESWYLIGGAPTLPVRDITAFRGGDGVSNELCLYASLGMGTFSDSVCRSTDGGATWEHFAWCYKPQCVAPGMTVPNTPLCVLIGTAEGGILAYAFNGQYLGTLNAGLESPTVNCLAYDPSASLPMILFAGTDDGLYARTL